MIGVYITIGICITTLVIAFYYVHRLMKVKLSKYLSGRPKLKDDEFSRLFTADKAEIAVQSRKILQNWTDVNISGMLPTDELCRDIGLGQIDCLDIVDFIVDIEKEFRVKIPDGEAKKMRTFNDIVDYIAKTRQ